jgi:hypothetical protein
MEKAGKPGTREGTDNLRHLDFLQLQLLVRSPSSVFFLSQQKRGERERIARNIPKEGNRCTGRGKGGGADFFLLLKLPFGSVSGGETAGATKDLGDRGFGCSGRGGCEGRVCAST